jgi:putative membrane protein
MMGHSYDVHMSGWGVAAACTGSLLLGVALVLAAFALLSHRRRAATVAGDQPEQLLAARYARGEVDDEEYHRRLDTLRRSSSPTPFER